MGVVVVGGVDVGDGMAAGHAGGVGCVVGGFGCVVVVMRCRLWVCVGCGGRLVGRCRWVLSLTLSMSGLIVWLHVGVRLVLRCGVVLWGLAGGSPGHWAYPLSRARPRSSARP